ncbi:hypothetical protein IAT38_001605 [Cryptococcus sp. DSM 104549]
MPSLTPLTLLALLPLLPLPSLARTITIKNSCPSTLWPGMHTGAGAIPSQATGWELAAGGQTVFEVADDWTAGRIWARTGCVVQDGKFQCLTGQCASGDGGSQLCENSDQPPATLAEFTLIPDGEDNFDISLVDGFNVPLSIIPSIPSCPQPQCQVNINQLCPPLLRTSLDQDGVNLGCIAPCNAGFGQEIYGNRACCTGAYANPDLCVACGVDYYSLFKDNCNTSYAYAYDEKSKTALWTCPGRPDYTIEFCPAGSDYVGAKEASNAYVDATAKCSNLATVFSETFTVGPSPTSLATTGTLEVVATVATGVDGAAAIQVGATSEAGASGAEATATATGQATAVTATGVEDTVNNAVPSATAATAVASDQTGGITTGPEVTATAGTATYAHASATAISQLASPDGEGSTVTVPATTIIVTQYITVTAGDSASDPAVDGTATTSLGDVLAVEAPTTAASGAGGQASVFTVVDESTLVQVINGDATATGTATGDGVLAVEATDTRTGGGGGLGEWGSGNWLSAVPPGMGGHAQQRKVSI